MILIKLEVFKVYIYGGKNMSEKSLEVRVAELEKQVAELQKKLDELSRKLAEQASRDFVRRVC